MTKADIFHVAWTTAVAGTGGCLAVLALDYFIPISADVPIPEKAYTCVPPNHPGMEGISFWDKGNLVCIIKERDVTMVPCLKSHRPEKHAKKSNA